MQVFNIATLFNSLNHYVAARLPLEFEDSDKLLSTVEKLTELAIQGYEQPIRDILQTRYAGKISGFNRITVGEKSVSGEFYDMFSPFRTTRHTFYISPTRIDISVIGGSMPVYSEVDFAAAVNKTCGDGKKPCKVKRGSTEYFRCVPKTWKCGDEKAALKGAIKEETKRAKSTGSSKPSPKEAKVIEGIIAKGIEAQQKGTRKSKNKYSVKPDATPKKSEKTAKPEQRSLLEGKFPQSRNVPGANKLNDALGEINSRPSKVTELAGKKSTKPKKERKGKSDKVTDLFQKKLEEGDIVGAIDQSLLLADQGKRIAKEGLEVIRSNQQEIDQKVEDTLKRFPRLGDDQDKETPFEKLQSTLALGDSATSQQQAEIAKLKKDMRDKVEKLADSDPLVKKYLTLKMGRKLSDKKMREELGLEDQNQLLRLNRKVRQAADIPIAVNKPDGGLETVDIKKALQAIYAPDDNPSLSKSTKPSETLNSNNAKTTIERAKVGETDDTQEGKAMQVKDTLGKAVKAAVKSNGDLLVTGDGSPTIQFPENFAIKVSEGLRESLEDGMSRSLDHFQDGDLEKRLAVKIKAPTETSRSSVVIQFGGANIEQNKKARLQLSWDEASTLLNGFMDEEIKKSDTTEAKSVKAEVVTETEQPKRPRVGDKIRAIADNLRKENEKTAKAVAGIVGAAGKIAQNQDNLINEVSQMVQDDLDRDEVANATPKLRLQGEFKPQDLKKGSIVKVRAPGGTYKDATVTKSYSTRYPNKVTLLMPDGHTNTLQVEDIYGLTSYKNQQYASSKSERTRKLNTVSRSI